MTQPSPDERLRQRLAHLPDACRALLAALERQAARGGGDVEVAFEVTMDGEIEGLRVTTRFAKA